MKCPRCTEKLRELRSKYICPSCKSFSYRKEKLTINNLITKLRTLKYRKGIKKGEEVYLSPGCYLDGGGGLKIGNFVKITRGCIVLTHTEESGKKEYAPVNIGDNVFIGVDTTILKGVTIGNNVIIGAKSLVTKDIPSNSIAYGIPAKVKRKLG
jgi:acetyltransferase-like isoleucine patch superfamily enzyme